MMVEDVLRDYLPALKRAIDGLAMDRLSVVVEKMLAAYDKQRQIFVFGNGGSGSTASHLACDINKGVSLGLAKRFKLICLNDNVPTILAYANDVSYEDVFVEQLKNLLNPGDLVIGISGSGNSRNVIKAIRYGNEHGAESVALTGFDGGKLAQLADISLIAPADDMQMVEDIHLIVCHMIMQMLCNRLGNRPDSRGGHQRP